MEHLQYNSIVMVMVEKTQNEKSDYFVSHLINVSDFDLQSR